MNGKGILIAGGTGFIGGSLAQAAIHKGHQVRILTRNLSNKQINNVSYFEWDPESAEIDAESLTGVDCIVNLAGENVGEGRWTSSRKRQILESRLQALNLLKSAVEKVDIKPSAFISASAVGYYGNSLQTVDEDSPAGTGFLADVTRQWENAAMKLQDINIRTTILRIGLVLSANGGALPKMALPVRMFAGSALGSGRQHMAWIHIDDLCSMILSAAFNDAWTGIYNAAAPQPATNEEFIKTLARTLHRPVLLPAAPEFALRAALGEMSSMLLEGAPVSPRRALAQGFQFQFPDLAEALDNLLA